MKAASLGELEPPRTSFSFPTSASQKQYLKKKIPRGPAGKVALQLKKTSSEPRSAYLFTPHTPLPRLAVQIKCARHRYCTAITAACLPASLPLAPGCDRDLGCLRWQGTHRVTQIYLQHSSISLHARCWLAGSRKNDCMNCTGAHNNPPLPNHAHKETKTESPSCTADLKTTFPYGSIASAVIISIGASMHCMYRCAHAEKYLKGPQTH